MESSWKKVVVGFEGNDESQDALRLGRELASVVGADLHVAVVLPRGRIPFEAAIAGGQLSEQLDERLFEDATRLLDGTKFTPARLDGGLSGRSAARALFEYAHEEDIDLIVVGSSHHGKVGRVFPGSVGESLLRGAPCAVAVAPRGFARQGRVGFGVIGVAYDGSDEAQLALAESERLVRSVEAQLRVITIVSTQTAFQMQGALAGELLEDIRDEFRRVLEKRAVAAERQDEGGGGSSGRRPRSHADRGGGRAGPLGDGISRLRDRPWRAARRGPPQ